MPSDRYKEITGQQFGRLTALRPAGRDHHGCVIWDCRCECGSTVTVSGCRLRGGETRSCGCLHTDVARKLNTKHGYAAKAGPEYRAYLAAKARCNNPHHSSYRNYGGRSIKFLFPDFPAFFAALGPRPGPNFSVDRPDTNGPYAPGNVRWATRTEQARNQRTTKLTLQKAEEIRCRYAAGERVRAIACAFGINSGTVDNVVKGRTWLREAGGRA